MPFNDGGFSNFGWDSVFMMVEALVSYSSASSIKLRSVQILKAQTEDAQITSQEFMRILSRRAENTGKELIFQVVAKFKEMRNSL